MRERRKISRRQHMGDYRYRKEITQSEKDADASLREHRELLLSLPIEYFDGQQPIELKELQKNAIVRCYAMSVHPPIVRYEITQLGKDALRKAGYGRIYEAA